MRIRVKPLAGNRKFAKYLQELPDRVREAQDRIAYQSAAYVLEGLKQRLPTSGDAGLYRDSLQIVKIPGGYAVCSRKTTRKVEQLDAEGTVVYVRPYGRKRPAPPEVAILARYSPWTLGTLPLVPPRKFGRLVSRKVRQDEVAAVAEKNRKDEKQWRSDLLDAGVQVPLGVRIAPDTRVLPDLAFQALRIEYGFGGLPKRAHWRPALRDLARKGLAGILKDNGTALEPLLSEDYRNVAQPVDGNQTAADTSRWVGFEKKVRG